MLLSPESVVPFLLGTGDLSEREALGPNLAIRACGGRNVGFLVEGIARPVYLKQVRDRQPHLLAAQAREAAFCRAVWEVPELGDLRAAVPRVVRCDKRRGILTLEARIRHRPLFSVRDKASAKYLTRDAARWAPEIGRFLGTLHSTSGRLVRGDLGDPRLAVLPAVAIFIMDVRDPIQPVSLSARTLLALTKQDVPLQRLLSYLGARWRSNTLVHGDVRWDNLLVPTECDVVGDLGDRSTRNALRVIDWELVQWGDPAWDLACLLYEYCLVAWQAERKPGDTPGDLAAWGNATREPPIERCVREALRFGYATFLSCYLNCLNQKVPGWRDLSGGEFVDELPTRISACFGLRLLQAAFEYGVGLPRLEGESLRLARWAQATARSWQSVAQPLSEHLRAGTGSR